MPPFLFSYQSLVTFLCNRYNGPVLVGSHKGGMDIEAVAEEFPEDIHAIPVDIKEGITDKQAMDMAKLLRFQGDAQKKAAANMKALYSLFIATDSTQVEINPMALASDGNVYCVDAKLNFDDNASFRQKEVSFFVMQRVVVS